MDEFQIVAAKQALTDVAPDLFSGWAEILNEHVRIQDDNQVTGVLNEGPEFLLALALGGQGCVLSTQCGRHLGTPQVALGQLAEAPMGQQGSACGKYEGTVDKGPLPRLSPGVGMVVH